MAGFSRLCVLALIAAVAMLADAPTASAILIANGLAPPDPANVVDASDGLTSNDRVDVANVGCTPEAPGFTCSTNNGAPTDVYIAPGVSLNAVLVGVTSSATVDAFNVGSVSARDSSHVTVNGIEGGVFATDTATLVMNGVAGSIAADEDAHIELNGSSGTTAISGSASIHVVGGTNSGSNITIGDEAYFEMSGGAQFRTFNLTSSTPGLLRGGEIGSSFPGSGAIIGPGAWLAWTGGKFKSSTEVQVDGLLQVFGSNFLYDGVPVGFGTLMPPNTFPHQLEGTLASGDTFSVPVAVGSGGAIQLPEAEPAIGALTALGVVALFRRRRLARPY